MGTAADLHPLGQDGASSAPHGTRKEYALGFGLSVALTALSFWLVMAHVISSPVAAAFAVMGLGFVQVVVHMAYFLHMNSRSEGGWNLLALLFTALLVLIVLSGSVWVMYHLNTNMMPASPHEMMEMP
ncbi:MAG: cyoD [Caulobacteraceae bacterium]|jgi:cytochrome o ubiquinol oxidase operon protein cyoD|nr:cyoD [Caulobacteraceae bacterium]